MANTPANKETTSPSPVPPAEPATEDKPRPAYGDVPELPVTLVKGGKKVTVTTAADFQQRRWDGWRLESAKKK